MISATSPCCIPVCRVVVVSLSVTAQNCILYSHLHKKEEVQMQLLNDHCSIFFFFLNINESSTVIQRDRREGHLTRIFTTDTISDFGVKNQTS